MLRQKTCVSETMPSYAPCCALCRHRAPVVDSVVHRKHVASAKRRPAAKPRDSRNTTSPPMLCEAGNGTLLHPSQMDSVFEPH